MSARCRKPGSQPCIGRGYARFYSAQESPCAGITLFAAGLFLANAFGAIYTQ